MAQKAVGLIVVSVIALACVSAVSAKDAKGYKGDILHKPATALTWLTNPQHAHHGTVVSRRHAISRAKRQLMHQLKRSGWLGAALCVHGYEGSWTDGGSPYYGGLQMDIDFQQDNGIVFYRRWGTADHWPVWAQLVTAYRAWQVRGWWPWPNTARYCGLL